MTKESFGKDIPNKINASVTLQSVIEESNLGYKPLIQDEDETFVSHHRKHVEKEVGLPLPSDLAQVPWD